MESPRHDNVDYSAKERFVRMQQENAARHAREARDERHSQIHTALKALETYAVYYARAMRRPDNVEGREHAKQALTRALDTMDALRLNEAEMKAFRPRLETVETMLMTATHGNERKA